MAIRDEGRAGALRMLVFLRRFALAATALLVVAFGLVAWDYSFEQAEVQAEENAALIGEYVQRLVQTQDVILTAAEAALERFVPVGNYSVPSHLFLRRLSDRIGGSVGVAFVENNGDFLVASFAFPAVGNVGDREYLRATPRGGLFVDRIVTRPQGVDALVVARRPAGEVGANGVWVSAVEIGVADEFLRRIALGGGQAASVIREDGTLLMRNRALDRPIRLGNEQRIMQVIRDGNGGVYRAKALTDGRERVYATRQVGDLPLYATFGISVQSILWDWALATGAAAVLFGTIGGAAYLMARSAARRMRAEAAQAALAFDRRLLEEAEKAAALRETMLRELNHRVKNSLQMIQALIRLQRDKPTGPDLEGISARVQAIGAIHDLLYQAEGTFDVDFAELLRRIGASEAIAPPEGGVEVVVEAEPMGLDVSVATPLALCAVELVTNAAKHAFGGAGGRVRLVLERRGAERGVLRVEDNGRGLPDGGRHSGLRVVETLVRQVGGTIRAESRNGARFTIEFPAALLEDRISAPLAAS